MKKEILAVFIFLIVVILMLFVYNGNFEFEDDSSATNIQLSVNSNHSTTLGISTNVVASSTAFGKDLSGNDFPVVKKAVLYKNGVAEEILPDDNRLTQMINYIMLSVEQKDYGWVRGVVENSSLEGFYKPRSGMYLVLELDSKNSVEFGRYDSAVVSHSDVIMIDSDSPSYHGEDTPFNYCFTPYYEQYGGYDNIPDILNVCGF